MRPSQVHFSLYMISRRTIRIKVMQTLYALEAGREHETEKPKQEERAQTVDTFVDLAENQKKGKAILTSKFDQSRDAFAYVMYLMFETARYAERDSHLRAGKNLPTQEDLSVNTKIAGNTLMWQTLEHPEFNAVIKNMHAEARVPLELIKKMYQQLAATDEYAEYIQAPSRNNKSEKAILEFILNHIILPGEASTAHLEETFIHWDDDAEQIQILITNYLNRPPSTHFKDILGDEKRDFAFRLLQTVPEKQDYLLEIIKPKLNNWDADRIAALDMILLQMGIAEFLFFETIPTKVTINEYIDLAKSYSTPQSGQFVNGLLDNIQKELTLQKKIQKVIYKNSTL